MSIAESHLQIRDNMDHQQQQDSRDLGESKSDDGEEEKVGSEESSPLPKIQKISPPKRAKKRDKFKQPRQSKSTKELAYL